MIGIDSTAATMPNIGLNSVAEITRIVSQNIRAGVAHIVRVNIIKATITNIPVTIVNLQAMIKLVHKL